MASASRIATVLLVACVLVGCQRKPAAPNAPIGVDKTQLVTVVTDDWNRFQATLRRYERSPGRAWKSVGPPIDVVLGREGYGWGRGVHGGGAPAGRRGPIKREGDGRSPAGAFEIGTAYGYEAARAGVSLPYVQATPELRCVDDPKSRHYNRVVSTANTVAERRVHASTRRALRDRDRRRTQHSTNRAGRRELHLHSRVERPRQRHDRMHRDAKGHARNLRPCSSPSPKLNTTRFGARGNFRRRGPPIGIRASQPLPR
jgi:hypothetical protein